MRERNGGWKAGVRGVRKDVCIRLRTMLLKDGRDESRHYQHFALVDTRLSWEFPRSIELEGLAERSHFRMVHGSRKLENFLMAF